MVFLNVLIMSLVGFSDTCNLYVDNKGASKKAKIPITFYIDPSFPEEFVSEIYEAEKVLEESSGINLFNLATTRPDVPERNLSSISWVKELKQYVGPWSGYSVFVYNNARREHIRSQIFVKKGENYFKAGKPHPKKMCLNCIVIHEMLHSLGFDHVNDRYESIMNPKLVYGQEETVSKLDIKNIKCAFENKN